jgi:hypothetical protein
VNEINELDRLDELLLAVGFVAREIHPRGIGLNDLIGVAGIVRHAPGGMDETTAPFTRLLDTPDALLQFFLQIVVLYARTESALRSAVL